MSDNEELAAWAPRVLEELAQGPRVYCYPGLMGAVCERLVAHGLATKAPVGMMPGAHPRDPGLPQFRYELAAPSPPKIRPLPTVAGGYGAIYADPAWRFLTRSAKGRDRCPEARHYPTMPLDQIKAMPVADVAAPDCALFLWVLDPMLKQGLDVGAAWGFTFKTVAFTWAKTTPNDKWAFGPGYWTRANPEMCLLFTRGRPKRLHADVRQLVVADVREHSRKPEGMHERVERLVGGPYLELFARPTRRRRGWSYWGNQLDRFTQGGNEARLRQSDG